MKTIKYICMLAFAAFVASCSLEEERISVTDPDVYFRTLTECQSVLNGCYMPMNTICNATFFVVTEGQSDLVYLGGSNIPDAYLDFSPATPRFGSTAWQQGYLGVSRCNYAIWGLLNAPEGAITEEQKAELLCEAKALRGFYYLFLTNMFGDVPLYFEPVRTMEDQDAIGAIGRIPAKDTRDSLMLDLMKYAPQAPQTRTSDNKGARVGAALAYMIIAKCAMWNANEDPAYWDVAIDAIESIEAIYGDFSQYDYMENVLFRNKNTPESILEVQHAYKQGGISYTSNLAGRCIPTNLVVTDGKPYFDGVLIEEIGTMANPNTVIRPNKAFVETQSRYSKDIRAHVNMAWGYDGVNFKNASEFSPYMGPKFWCPDIQINLDGNNYKMFRYADAILMKAECLCETGDYEGAITYLNKTRVRAGLNPWVDTTPSKLRDEIRAERARELFGEFQRKFDLVRWNIYYETVSKKSDYKTLKNYLKPCHRYYPIPDTEIAKSKYILDNDEYERYGF